MKEIKFFIIITGILFALGCGEEEIDFSTQQRKSGYWEIENTESKETLYKGFLASEGLMLNKSNESWSGMFRTNKERSRYSLLEFSPLSGSQKMINLEFIMNETETESLVTFLDEKPIKLHFNSTNLPTAISLSSKKFSNIFWRDQENTYNSLKTNITGKNFTILSNKAVEWGGECTFSGEMPNSSVNYAWIRADYACTDGSRGVSSLHMATNRDSSELIVGFESLVGFDNETDLKAHIILFK